MGIVKVKNKKGTSDKTPPAGYSSWLDFWEKKTNRKADGCKVINCLGGADVGGHVIIAGEGGKEYILPLCYHHNSLSETEVFETWDYNLVPVVS